MNTKSVTKQPTSIFARTPAVVQRRRTAPRAVRRACLETLEERRLLSFATAVPFAAGVNPQSVVVADLNGDARMDLAVANYGGGSVSVLLGNGNGTFQPAVNFTTGVGPRGLAVGDFNADGKPDLVTANDNDLSVLLGSGGGTFQAPTHINIGSEPTSVAVGDFNADGKLDLAATSNFFQPGYFGWYGYYPGYNTGVANVLLGTGTGSFAPPTSTGLGYGTYTSVAVADFNGDGKKDLAVVSPDNYYLSVLWGSGTGTLGSSASFAAGLSQSVTAGDVNGDGKVDLVTASASANGVSVLIGTGAGSFGASQTYAAASNARSVAIADFNGDGKVDLVTANAGDGTIGVLLGAGAGTFQPPVSATTGSAPAAVAVGDFNGDGRPDAATANAGANSVSALLNDGAWPAADAPRITIGDVTVTEGNIGTVGATFTVSLSAAYTQPVTVRYTTADGSATAAAGDYQPTTGMLTFAAGETSKTITVLVNGDRLVEDSEFFSVRLGDPTNAFIADGAGAGTIVDDEPRITIDYSVSVQEGNTGTTPMNFTVRLSAPSDVPVSVNYSTAEGDTDWQGGGYYYYYGPPAPATSGVDFQAKAGTLTFAPGETVKTVSVLVIGDHVAEPNEVLSLNLTDATGGGAVIASGHAVGTIGDDEPYASIAGATVTEGNSGTKLMTFTVTLSAASDVPVSVNVATADGSATVIGNDYQAKSGTVTFAPGATSQTFTVSVNADRLGEGDEYFVASLSGATNSQIGSGTAYGYITDDEPRISIANASVIEGNSGTRVMTFTVKLSAAYDQTVSVNFATQNGSATVTDGDYVAKSGSLSFAPGETTKTFTVTIKGDKKKEADEYFYVILSGASTNAWISSGTAFGNIFNDDGRHRLNKR
jgi:hypothetical protein